MSIVPNAFEEIRVRQSSLVILTRVLRSKWGLQTVNILG